MVAEKQSEETITALGVFHAGTVVRLGGRRGGKAIGAGMDAKRRLPASKAVGGGEPDAD